MAMSDKEFGEYMAELRVNSGYKSQRQLAEASGISNGTIARIENGTQKPTAKTLATLILYLRGANIAELMVNAGLFTEEQRIGSEVLRNQFTGKPELTEAHMKYIKEQKSKYSNEGFHEYKPLYVPILGNIPAGKPIFAEENIEGYMPVANLHNYDEKELFVLSVRGDSMIGSRIHDGDKVLVHMRNDVESGEIAVVSVNGEDATLKRVKKVDGNVILYPDNPLYDPIVINNENARIIGKVIQVIFVP